MTNSSIETARKEQVRCAAEIERVGWDEQGAALGLGDWFAEEFLLSLEDQA